jgi:hypothetical protein
MARKKIGVTELQWTCPNCTSLNRGSSRTCANCGAAQPAGVQFTQALRPELLSAEQAAKVEAAADIHCPFCGTRNPASATACSQCGGELAGGKQRETGQALGAFAAKPAVQIACPNCGTQNPDSALACTNCGASLAPAVAAAAAPVPPPAAAPAVPARRMSPLAIAGIIAVVLLVCAGLFYLASLLGRTDSVSAVVQAASWERSIPVLALQPVEYQTWQDQIPAEAELGSCREEVRSEQSEPVAGALEVCGTPYTVDSGQGYGDVVQDCVYQVLDQYCSYTVEEWRTVEMASISGSGPAAGWPEPALAAGERLGDERQETYSVVFAAGDQTYSFETSDYALYQQLQVGSEWNLKVNSFGAVVGVEP